MRVHVVGEKVMQAASKLGYRILNAPLVYLGTKVRCTMSRVNEWNDVVDKIEGFDNLVKDTWMHMDITDSNSMILLKKKLQSLKIIIREWTKNAKKCSYKKKSSIQSKLSDIDKSSTKAGVMK
nr:RNA-directed DNA polymerase, eukaryota, reverse transcriptase zinc-binding domain protein [Tanacetum cinerariifolium]